MLRTRALPSAAPCASVVCLRIVHVTAVGYRLWTAMLVGGLTFQFAATGSEEARQLAWHHFAAVRPARAESALSRPARPCVAAHSTHASGHSLLAPCWQVEFLHNVTGTRGFIARSAVRCGQPHQKGDCRRPTLSLARLLPGRRERRASAGASFLRGRRRRHLPTVRAEQLRLGEFVGVLRWRGQRPVLLAGVSPTQPPALHTPLHPGRAAPSLSGSGNGTPRAMR